MTFPTPLVNSVTSFSLPAKCTIHQQRSHTVVRKKQLCSLNRPTKSDGPNSFSKHEYIMRSSTRERYRSMPCKQGKRVRK